MTLRTVRIDTCAVAARAGALAAVARLSRRKTRNVARDLNTAKAMDTVGQSREVGVVGQVVDILVRDPQFVPVVEVDAGAWFDQ